MHIKNKLSQFTLPVSENVYSVTEICRFDMIYFSVFSFWSMQVSLREIFLNETARNDDFPSDAVFISKQIWNPLKW